MNYWFDGEFVFLSWFWIDMALSAPWYVPRLAAGAAALLFVLSAGRHFNRRHRHLDWAGAVRELDATGHAVLPVHFDGSVELQWALKLQRCGERYCQVP